MFFNKSVGYNSLVKGDGIMTWTVLIVTILVSLLKILATCLPTGVVAWLLNKFATHPKLDVANTTISFEGKLLAEKDKRQIIKDFNEAILSEKHYVYPGNEESFLYPEDGETPLVIQTKIGKSGVKLFVYKYNDRVYVAKQFKKKVTAYSLFPDNFQNHPSSKTDAYKESIV